MPGHKGKSLYGRIFEGICGLDFTELEGTGNLYAGTPPIITAEKLAAGAYGARDCFFLTGGSTQGLMAALSLSAGPGDTVLIDRACHASVYNALALLDLRPEFVYPEYFYRRGITGAVPPEQVEKRLKGNNSIKTVCITSPTYCGVLSDIKTIAGTAEKYGAALIVDEAHGAHLPFIAGHASAAAQGAALSVSSAHKTLPALGQSAFLFTDGRFDPRDVRRACARFGTSSPSYPIMASMDLARAYMEGPGAEEYARVIGSVDALRRKINAGQKLRALAERDGGNLKLDPARLVVNTSRCGISGYEAAELLEKKHGVVCEMADTGNIVFILTCADSGDDLERLERALESLEKLPAGRRSAGYASAEEAPSFPPEAKVKVSPRDAMFAGSVYMPLGDCCGRISGEHIAPYPPGIPVVAAGEEITEGHIAYLEKKKYNINREVRVIVQP